MADGVDPPRLDDAAIEQRLTAVEGLLDEVERFPGPTSEAALEAVQILLEVYGEALARVVDQAPGDLLETLSADELVAHLLALHGLHPDPVETRVRQVLDVAAGDLEARGVTVELLGIEDGTARIRMTGGGCHGPSAELDKAVTEWVLALAPELADVLPVHERTAGHTTTLIPVEALLRPRTGAARR
jgi:hypothetical protein